MQHSPHNDYYVLVSHSKYIFTSLLGCFPMTTYDFQIYVSSLDIF